MWSEKDPFSSLWESYEGSSQPPFQAELAVLALQRIAVYSLTESELHLEVLQVGLRSMAVAAEGVHLLVLIDGLAVLPVFVNQCTLAAILEVVLGDGRLHCLPPAMSALSHHCCGQ